MSYISIKKAFIHLISEITSSIDFLKQEGIDAIQVNDISKGHELLELIKVMTEYKAQLTNLYDNWSKDIYQQISKENLEQRLMDAITSTVQKRPSNSSGKTSDQQRHLNIVDVADGQNEAIELNPPQLGSLRFTNVISGILGELSVENIGWNGFVKKGICFALEKGIPFDTLNTHLNVNIKQGEYYEQGYSPIPSTNISLQRMDANRAAESLIRLSKIMGCNLDILIEWGGNEKARYPGKQGHIECKGELEI